MKLSDNPNCILKRSNIIKELTKSGYEPTEVNFKKYLKEEIKKKSVIVNARKLRITEMTVYNWLSRFKIKYVKKQGGNHNPYGRKGNPDKAKHIQMELEGKA